MSDQESGSVSDERQEESEEGPRNGNDDNQTRAPDRQAATSASVSSRASDSDNETTASGGGSKSAPSRKRPAASVPGAKKPAKKLRPPSPVPRKSGMADEIEILQGLLDCIQKGSDPFADVPGFYSVIKDKLALDQGVPQLADTIRRLKRRYQWNIYLAKKGKDPNKQSGRRKIIYDLSRKIWGLGNSYTPLPQTRMVKSEAIPKKLRKLLNGYPRNERLYSFAEELLRNEAMVDMDLVTKGLDLIEKTELLKIEENLRKLELETMEILMKRSDLIRDLVVSLLDVLKR